MTEKILKSHQHLLDRKFHEYKLAALTGLMSTWGEGKLWDEQVVAATCGMIAEEMERVDRAAESGS